MQLFETSFDLELFSYLIFYFQEDYDTSDGFQTGLFQLFFVEALSLAVSSFLSQSVKNAFELIVFGHAIQVSFSRYCRLRDKTRLTIAHSSTVFEGKGVKCGHVAIVMTTIFFIMSTILFQLKAFLS